MAEKKRYWLKDGEYLISFSKEDYRDKYVRESDIALKSQLCEDGWELFTTETIFEGTTSKYQIIQG